MKKILAGVLAAMMLSTSAAGAAEFTDITGHWAEGTIRILAYKGVVDGVTDTEFQPEGQVTRAQYLKMAMEATGISTAELRSGECLDASYDDWFAPYLQGALDKGLIPKQMVTGYKAKVTEAVDENGSEYSKVIYTGAFNGNLPITREDMAYLSASMYQYVLNAKTMKDMNDTIELEFTDIDRISDWVIEGLKIAVSNRFIDGMDDGTFAPDSITTRAQASTVIERIMDKLGK